MGSVMGKTAEARDQIEVEGIEEIAEDEVQIEQPSDEAFTAAQEGESEGDLTQDDEDEVLVSIGEESPPQTEEPRAPEWVRELRKQNREKERRIRELEAKLQTTTQTENKPVVLGAKPKLEDHDYDTDKFEAALSDWYERKRATDQEAEKARQAEQAQRDAWQSRLDSYGKARAELKVRDFEDAESTVQELFDVTQQGIVVQGAENPALVIYALGKNPKKAKEIADIKDPVKFAFTVAKLERELKVTNRKAAPPPERTVQGTGRVSGSVDSTLERLRTEAEKTGDMTKVMAYKRQLRAKQT
jgi:hypothetical protein